MKLTGLPPEIANDVLVNYLAKDPQTLFDRQSTELQKDFYAMKATMIANYTLLGTQDIIQEAFENITQKPSETFASFQTRVEDAYHRANPYAYSKPHAQLHIM